MFLIHYAQARTACGVRPTMEVSVTTSIEHITCPACLVAVLSDVDENVQGWYDRDKSAYITETFTDGASLFLGKSSQCRARGVVRGESGKIYCWTIRRHGHGDPIAIKDQETRFLMHEWKWQNLSLSSVAEGLAGFDGQYATSEELFAFAQEVTAIRYRELSDAAAILPTVITDCF